MRTDAIALEEERLKDIETLDDYACLHERHRIFPAVFEDRDHRRILDVAAGVGVVGRRIRDHYRVDEGDVDLICNDICPTCLKVLRENGLQTVSFSIDDPTQAFPFEDHRFDAVVALATIEHVIHIDHFVEEIRRILTDEGRFYVSAPNYSGLTYLLPFLWSGKTFHDPLREPDRYEFYAHVRYFTYKTLRSFIASFGFALEAVYIGLPHSSSRYRRMCSKSRLKALSFRAFMKLILKCGSPRWASEPVLCFRKTDAANGPKPRKIIL